MSIHPLIERLKHVADQCLARGARWDNLVIKDFIKDHGKFARIEKPFTLENSVQQLDRDHAIGVEANVGVPVPFPELPQ